MAQAKRQSIPPRRRRWLQFSLRTLLALTTVVAVFLGWLGWRLKIARDQAEAVAAIQDTGAYASYDFEMEALNEESSKFGFGSITPVQPDPPAPAWLCQLVGIDFFADVVYVDAERGPSAGRPGAVGSEPTITDREMAHIATLSDLRFLHLGGQTQVTDAGVAYVSRLTELEKLYLNDTKISDAGTTYLRPLKNLVFLGLSGTQVSDAGLVHLAGLTKLKQLVLANTNVSDAGLRHLEGLKSLGMLSLEKTRVTDEGVEKLQQALPNCRIDY